MKLEEFNDLKARISKLLKSKDFEDSKKEDLISRLIYLECEIYSSNKTGITNLLLNSLNKNPILTKILDQEIKKLINSEVEPGQYYNRTFTIDTENNKQNLLEVIINNNMQSAFLELINKDKRFAIRPIINGGELPIVISVRMGMVACTEILLDAGADPNTVANNGWPLICIAASNNFIDTTKLLVKRGADITKTNINGDTPIILASKITEQNTYLYLSSLYRKKNIDIFQTRRHSIDKINELMILYDKYYTVSEYPKEIYLNIKLLFKGLKIISVAESINFLSIIANKGISLSPAVDIEYLIYNYLDYNEITASGFCDYWRYYIDKLNIYHNDDQVKAINSQGKNINY